MIDTYITGRNLKQQNEKRNGAVDWRFLTEQLSIVIKKAIEQKRKMHMEQNFGLNPITREKVKIVNKLSGELSVIESKIAQLLSAIDELNTDWRKGRDTIDIVCGPDIEGYAMCEVSTTDLANFLGEQRKKLIAKQMQISKELAEILC